MSIKVLPKDMLKDISKAELISDFQDLLKDKNNCQFAITVGVLEDRNKKSVSARLIKNIEYLNIIKAELSRRGTKIEVIGYG